MVKERVAIVGSYNVGLFFKGAIIPPIGETVIGSDFFESAGGKGSNQVIAASKLGVDTKFIGKIGDDKYGKDALDLYKELGISTKSVFVTRDSHTGMSVILIDKEGNNAIEVVPGANYDLTKDEIDSAVKELEDTAIVGFQLENKLELVSYAIKRVHELGIPTMLDPAPAADIPDEIYKYLDYIKPNEHEAKILTGVKVNSVESAIKAGKWFRKKGVNVAIITLGENGVVIVQQNEKVDHYEAPVVEPVDTTGAGDCFSGAFMAAIAKKSSLDEAVDFANSAAALSVQKPGVVESLPTEEEVLDGVGSSRE